jgi:DNA-binding transcriptional MerR regulator
VVRSVGGAEGSSVGTDVLPVGGEFSMQQASVLLNIPAPTIRSWERRYGVPVAERSRGGHRRYTADQLGMLRRIRDEIASGHTARAAATRVIQEQSSPPDPRIQAFLAAVHQLDSATVSQLLDASSHTFGLARTLDEVLFPAMREVGRWWETGRCEVAHEQLVTETSRAWLSRLNQTLPACEAGTEPILLTCGPRDHHTLGLESIGALLNQRGRACRMLGAPTPAASLAIAVKATGATAVIMVSHLPSARRPAIESLRGIQKSGIQIFYAGNAFLSAQARKSVPGRYLGTNLSQAADMILADITAGTTSQRSKSANDDPTSSKM